MGVFQAWGAAGLALLLGVRGLAGTGAGMLTLECTRRITSPAANALSPAWGSYWRRMDIWETLKAVDRDFRE